MNIPPVVAQTPYQVRFGRGPGALDDVARHADVVIWVDALPTLVHTSFEPTVVPTIEGLPVIHADLRTRSQAADWMLDQQVQAGVRVSVAVIAAHDSTEDTLAAGAVIDALAARGIDFSSPEAAVACASFTALERAVGHLFTASVSGRELIAAGHADVVGAASDVDAGVAGAPSGIDCQPPVVA
ncbi:hypothetical protein [Subtercola boreus]|uniref:2-phosphosulfolactate phosphatase n=1 Tax=Subtercola boreus TaxID=120213 RepID=A0A3E0WB76_9MICO|nr:hypothetical protein [Subtercola boreus]RFA19477.1 hypothetical protein B7R24_12635 [Subtercola boreus]RFA19738.1 hypothetical protein B7R23_12615 [Subtercola boreus]RFA26104.1 hypothetical protein B7R25_12735 [Subtercola boreus]